jgi:hypothetical protein
VNKRRNSYWKDRDRRKEICLFFYKSLKSIGFQYVLLILGKKTLEIVKCILKARHATEEK